LMGIRYEGFAGAAENLAQKPDPNCFAGAMNKLASWTKPLGSSAVPSI
jgi:hypothetical protein